MGFFSKLRDGLGSAPTAIEKPTGAQKTTLATAERIRNVLGIRQLESMPAQAARAFQLASDPKAKGADFVKVIESDEVISARIIRIANSVYFFRGQAANDIEKAVANIGLNELRCLLSASMLKSLLQLRHPARDQIWANSVATGICCRALSGYTNIPDGEAFLCGLLHDVGKLIMLRRGGDLYDEVLRKVSSESKDFITAEEAVFELNHVEVGKWVGEMWNFPTGALKAISEHHDSWAKEQYNRGRATTHGLLVRAADTISHALGIGLPPHFKGFQQLKQGELPAVFQQLGISTNDGESFIKNFTKQFEEEYSKYQPDEQ